MKLNILPAFLTVVVVLFSGCKTVPSETPLSENEEIRFIQQARRGLLRPTDEEIKKWRFTTVPGLIPESAEFTNINDMRLLLAANPTRYEAYLSYCRNLATRGIAENRAMTQEEAEAAIYAYRLSQEIIENENIANPIDGRKFFSIALMTMYIAGFENESRDPENSNWIDKIMDVYPEFFLDVSNAEFPILILTVAVDHWKLGNQERALEYIELAKRIPSVNNEHRDLILSAERMIQAGPPK